MNDRENHHPHQEGHHPQDKREHCHRKKKKCNEPPISTTPSFLNNDDDPHKLYKFLTDIGISSTAQAAFGGFSYKPSYPAYQGCTFFQSYYATAAYFSDYVNKLYPAVTVTDVFNPGNYTLTPDPAQSSADGPNLQVERVNIWNGYDIYDGACLQIALALYQNDTQVDNSAFINSLNILYTVGLDGNQPSPLPSPDITNRAVTQVYVDPQSQQVKSMLNDYNGTTILAPLNCYHYRMIPKSWICEDPLGDPKFQVVTTKGNPSAEYPPGSITWLDWKAITGEMVWGLFLGPLLSYMITHPKQPVPADILKIAINSYTALSSMATPCGAFCYTTVGGLGNDGMPVPDGSVSIENNISTLAALRVFKEALQISNISNLNDSIDNHISALLSFFQVNAFNKSAVGGGYFYQGGTYSYTTGIFTPDTFAVDVNTWGISALGVELIDFWFGAGACKTIWKNVKTKSGYYPSGTPTPILYGVGYEEKNNKIISGEWTFGAINALRVMLSSATYKNDAEIQADHDSMVKNINLLRTDKYPSADLVNIPPNWSAMIPLTDTTKYAYLYASTRYAIPFGWVANPLPSLTSTSWALMVHYQYNPFTPDGSYTNFQFSN